jgi:hypothetical protein
MNSKADWDFSEFCWGEEGRGKRGRGNAPLIAIERLSSNQREEEEEEGGERRRKKEEEEGGRRRKKEEEGGRRTHSLTAV